MGGWYVYAINIGCGEPNYYPCAVQKRPGIDSAKGRLFQGMGAGNDAWGLRQTGLRHVPGSYVYMIRENAAGGSWWGAILSSSRWTDRAFAGRRTWPW